MAQLYRCSECGRLFNAVIQGKCRACKTGDQSSAGTGVSKVDDIKIIEPNGAITMGNTGGMPEFFADKASEDKSALDRLNAITAEVFKANPSLGRFTPSPADPESVVGISPGGELTLFDPVYRTYGVLRNVSAENIYGRRQGTRLYFSAPLQKGSASGMEFVDMVDLYEGSSLTYDPNLAPIVAVAPDIEAGIPAAPEPEKNPHEALLNPKRKLRIGQ